jgi:RimJ/RimL family protein N-acetyltransferase
MQGPEIDIRPTSLDDVDWIVETVAAAAARTVHVRPVSRERVIASLAEADRKTFVAFAQGRRVAHATMTQHLPRLCEFNFLVVAEPGRGFGRALVRHLVAVAFDEWNANRLYLEVAATNAVARALYESEGFVCEGCFRDGYPREDGAFEDLIPYAILARDRVPPATA